MIKFVSMQILHHIEMGATGGVEWTARCNTWVWVRRLYSVTTAYASRSEKPVDCNFAECHSCYRLHFCACWNRYRASGETAARKRPARLGLRPVSSPVLTHSQLDVNVWKFPTDSVSPASVLEMRLLRHARQFVVLGQAPLSMTGWKERQFISPNFNS